MQVQAFERHWQEYENTECGAELELSAMRVPFVMHEKKKKNYRKAIYAVARVGHQIKASELYIFTKVRSYRKAPIVTNLFRKRRKSLLRIIFHFLMYRQILSW